MATIFALASAQGRAGVSIIRISGEKALSAAESMANTKLPLDGRRLCILRDASGHDIDQALVLTFSKGHSFTGECVAELHVHGSIAVVDKVLSELSTFSGLSLAEPGQFTRRAFLNDRLDLAEVEGLADLIDAETEVQRKLALSVFRGSVSHTVQMWRDDLISILSLVTALIDFSEEELPIGLLDQIVDKLVNLENSINTEVSKFSVAERVRQGFEVAIIGKPNTGKSTLFNYLAGRDAAITSEIAGTTRDVIEVRMDVKGIPVIFLDTAGIRESGDVIEQIGVSLAIDRAKSADIVVYLQEDISDFPTLDFSPRFCVLGKTDDENSDLAGVSGKTGFGVDILLDSIADELKSKSADPGIGIRLRTKTALDNAIELLLKSRMALTSETFSEELVAEDLLQSVKSLSSIIGEVDVEDLLGEIFSSFCIGK